LARAARDAVHSGGAALAAQLDRYRRTSDESGAGALSAGVVEEVARRLGAAADLEHGGFGGAPKFPHRGAVVLLLDVGGRELARQALDGMLRLEDPVAGGFFRYATRADWSVPHYEKMLVGNAELLEAYAHGFAKLREPRYRAAALRTVRYV